MFLFNFCTSRNVTMIIVTQFSLFFAIKIKKELCYPLNCHSLDKLAIIIFQPFGTNKLNMTLIGY